MTKTDNIHGDGICGGDDVSNEANEAIPFRFWFYTQYKPNNHFTPDAVHLIIRFMYTKTITFDITNIRYEMNLQIRCVQFISQAFIIQSTR